MESSGTNPDQKEETTQQQTDQSEAQSAIPQTVFVNLEENTPCNNLKQLTFVLLIAETIESLCMSCMK